MPISTDDDPRRSYPTSPRSQRAWKLVEGLQHRFVEALEKSASPTGDPGLTPIDWLRDGGDHGGGRRYAAARSPAFNRASVNVSTVHYDDLPDKRLDAATALSAIIHPDHPRIPSVHTHISWTELRDEDGYWRLMADLNPSLDAPGPKKRFDAMLEDVAGDLYDRGRTQGERYFYIPALERHRGVSHFYLEKFSTGDFDADHEFATDFGKAVIDEYADIFARVVEQDEPPTETERQRQLAYHTVYFFQVLTMDRGTTSGLLVHDQNDVGILASLPAFIDRELLASWQDRMTPPQDELLDGLVETLPDDHPCPVPDDIRVRLADVVRSHYRRHPQALKLQARGDVVPPTVDNHAAKRDD